MLRLKVIYPSLEITGGHHLWRSGTFCICEEVYFLYSWKVYRRYTPSQVMSDGYFKVWLLLFFWLWIYCIYLSTGYCCLTSLVDEFTFCVIFSFNYPLDKMQIHYVGFKITIVLLCERIMFSAFFSSLEMLLWLPLFSFYNFVSKLSHDHTLSFS